jgi:hypothetical protein
MATPIRELFVRLGLEKDEASFASGYASVEGLRLVYEKFSEKVKEATEWMREQINATAEAGESAKLLAQSTGINAQTLQKLGYVANVSGTSIDALNVGLRHLAKIGVSDLQGELLRLSDQFSKMPDSGRKTALAMEYFGRQGAALIPLLNRGRAGIQELMTEFEDLGGVIDDDGIKASEDYIESQKRLGAALTGLRNTIVLPLLKYFSEFALRIMRIVKGFRELYASSQGLRTAVAALAIALTTVGSVIALIGWAAAVKFLAALAIQFLASGVAALEAAAAWVLAELPLLLIVAAIGILLLALEDLYVFITGGDSVIGRALHKWLGPFKDWHEALALIWDKVQEGFKAGLAIIGGYFAGLWGQVKYLAFEAWDAILDYIKGIGKQVGEWFKGQIKEVLSFIPGGASISQSLFGGGAASPGAAAGQTAAVSNTSNKASSHKFSATFNVTAAPGQSPEETAGAAKSMFESWYNDKMAEAAAATG